ncbi:MAG: polysaccharide deacetylase family protein [Bdellovibrionales bacterium]|nr:polysaccharide deacetylase family protein [Bdellovibrionales bacterium]
MLMLRAAATFVGLLSLPLSSVAVAAHLQPEQWPKTVLRARDHARTLADWEHGGWSLGAVAERLVRSPNPQSETRRFCASLERLEDENLAVFDSMIRGESLRLDSPCQSRLRSRLERHWEREAEELERREGPIGAPIALRSIQVPVAAPDGPVLFRGGLGSRQVALTFDDGPDGERTGRLLLALEEWGARATFFATGQGAQRFPGWIQKTLRAGHTVGSHTLTHALLTKLNAEEARREIRGGLLSVLEAAPPGFPAAAFFRFPYGSRTGRLQELVRTEGMATFFWNMDSLDWKIRTAPELLARVKQELEWRDGGILIFHETLEQSVLALPYVLKWLSQNGWETAVFVNSGGGRSAEPPRLSRH